MKTSRLFLCLTALAVFTHLGSPARAAVVVTSPDFPPIGESFIATPGSVLTFFGGGGLTITVSNLILRVDSLIVRSHIGPDETDNFNATLLGDLSVNGSPTVPVSSSGPSTAILTGKWGNTTGTFDTEMLQLDLSGGSPFGPFMIRESPTKQSTGKTTITNLGGGGYKIDSFFDVFTELSIDGGASWMPQSVGGGPNPVHFDLGGAVPEPTALGLLGLSLLGALRRSRRVA